MQNILAGEHFFRDYASPTALLRTYQEKNPLFKHQVSVVEILYDADPSKCIKISKGLVQRQVGVVELELAIRFYTFLQFKLDDHDLAATWKKQSALLFPLALFFK